MSKKTITQLKEYFKAAKRPTENQFADLIDSYAHLDDQDIFSPNYKEKSFQVAFLDQQADRAVDILFRNDYVAGTLEVEVVGTFIYSNSVGMIRKKFEIGANPDNYIWNSPISRVMEASGPILDNIFIGNIIWDDVIKQYKLTIYHTGLSGNTYEIRIKHHAYGGTIALNNAHLSEVYLNPLLGQRKHYVHYNENIGVGTALPEVKLHVKEADNLGNVNKVSALFDRSEAAGGSTKIRLKYHSTADLELNSGYSGTGFEYGSYSDFNIINNGLSDTYGAINFVTSKMTRINIAGNGNVAIGGNASNSTQLLTLKGKQGYNEGGPSNGKNSTGLLRLQSGEGFGEVLDFGMNIGPSYGWIQPQDYNSSGTFYNLLLNPKGGNVGIGTSNPDQKLTVKGKIHAEDVIVDTNVPADYVFQKYYDNYSPIRNDYHMPNLNELEAYVKENKHLPEIPSGESMMKDGITIGDFQMKLLQKIEELTLYMISQNKEIENLKKLVNNA